MGRSFGGEDTSNLNGADGMSVAFLRLARNGKASP